MAKRSNPIGPEEWAEIEEHLVWAVHWLEAVQVHLREALSVGVWMKSDDSSDNRNKRRGISDAASDAWSATDELAKIAAPEMRTALNPLLTKIRELDEALRPLAESISDTMGENPVLDQHLRRLEDQNEDLLNSVRTLMDFRPAI